MKMWYMFNVLYTHTHTHTHTHITKVVRTLTDQTYKMCTEKVKRHYIRAQQSTTVFTLDAGLLAISQYSEGPATGHLDTGFSWFPCVYKQRLRWFPKFQVATTCFSFRPPDLSLLVTNFISCIHVK